MKGFFQKDLGRVFIDPDIVVRLCVLPELALSDVFVPPRDGPIPGDPLSQVTRKGVERYVSVDFNPQGEVLIDLRLLVRYGPSIRSSAALLQQKIIRRIEASTGLNVAKIDLKIDGIYRPAEPTPLPPPKEQEQRQIEHRKESAS